MDVTRTMMIIDFNGYYKLGGKFILKEYSIYVFHNMKVIYREFKLTKPLTNWFLSNYFTKMYYRRHYYPNHGIHWNRGNEKISDVVNTLIKLMSKVGLTIVRNNEQKQLLLNFIGDDSNEKGYTFVCCDTYGFDRELKMSTLCGNHDNPMENNCANDNVMAMNNWMKKGILSKKIYNKIKKHVAVDFNGYYIPVNKFVIKEFNSYVIDDYKNIFNIRNDKYFVVNNPNYIGTKPTKLEDLPFDYQVLYQNYYEIFGIDWDAGDFEFRTYQQDLRKYFDTSINIYVRNNGNKKLLLEIVGQEYKNKIIVLQKFGYREQPRMKTSCLFHDNRSKNNCAVDNSESMAKWIIENRKKLNITDF